MSKYPSGFYERVKSNIQTFFKGLSKVMWGKETLQQLEQTALL